MIKLRGNGRERRVAGWILLSVLCVCAADTAARKDSVPDVPKRMVLTTPDGREILLKDNSVWDAIDGKEMVVDKDFTVPLRDGRFVLISADGTWGFVNKELRYAEDIISVENIVAVGSGQSIDVNAATSAAQKQALDKAVIKARDAVKKIKITPARLRNCVERVEKDVDVDEQFVNGRGWTVTVTLTLDKGSILAVTGCAMDSTDSVR